MKARNSVDSHGISHAKHYLRTSRKAKPRHRQCVAGDVVWWRELDSNQRRRTPTGLQPVPFNHSGIPPKAGGIFAQLRGGVKSEFWEYLRKGGGVLRYGFPGRFYQGVGWTDTDKHGRTRTGAPVSQAASGRRGIVWCIGFSRTSVSHLHQTPHAAPLSPSASLESGPPEQWYGAPYRPEGASGTTRRVPG